MAACLNFKFLPGSLRLMATTELTPTPATHDPHIDMANAIRALAMDAVQAANSGHPGAPMGMADMAVALWGDRKSVV